MVNFHKKNQLTAITVIAGIIGGLILIQKMTRTIAHREPAATLSVFEPHAGGCAWTRIEPTRNIEDSLATFRSDCDGVRNAWSPALDQAIVWFGTDLDNLTAYVTKMDEKPPVELPLPKDSDLVLFAMGARGLPMAFTMSLEPVVHRDETGHYIEYLGKRYDVHQSGDGIDVLAHTLAFSGDHWKTIETSASRCCADSAPGITLLEGYKQHVASDAGAALSSSEILAHAPKLEKTDPTLATQLEKSLPPDTDTTVGHWARVVIPEQLPNHKPAAAIIQYDVHIWLMTSGADDVAYPTGHAQLVHRQTGALEPLPGATLDVRDQASFQLFDRFLLVVEGNTGMQPRLYDLSTGKLIWSSDLAHGVVFWPLILAGH